MQPYGGFDHNAQAVKIVTALERHYADFDGLNLTWETLEGLAKHNGPVTGDLPHVLSEYNARHDLELHTFASAEAQIAALSDDIAYNNHDLHDGLRAGLFSEDDIRALPIVGDAFMQVDQLYPTLESSRRMHEALRRVFGVMVSDVIQTSRNILVKSTVETVLDVRALDHAVIIFSNDLWHDLKVIREFLFIRMYRAPSVVQMRERVTKVVEELFPLFMNQTNLLPAEWQVDIENAKDETALARIVSDYISGMTDRFAQQEHTRLLG
jgi:dGTPase